MLNPDCTYVYTPKPGFGGQDVVGFQIRNPDGTTSVGPVVLNVRLNATLPETGADVRGNLPLAAGLVILGAALTVSIRGSRSRNRRRNRLAE